jgi:transposase
MQTLVEHGCGLDVHQATVVACLLWVRKDGRVQKQLRSFGTTTRELLQLREWLLAEGCTHVAMESTGVYWKPVYAVLEGSELQIVVANAQHVKKVPGHKTDVKDAEWIADLLAHGLLRPSFVPPPPIRELRDLTRYRRKLVESRSAERNRLLKLLESANIKLASVATDVFGVSGRRILGALIAGQASLPEMAELARGDCVPRFRNCSWRWKANYKSTIASCCGYNRAAWMPSKRTWRFSSNASNRDSSPRPRNSHSCKKSLRVDRTLAAVIIAELGIDMSVFRSVSQLASWVGVCPGSNESAGKRKSSRIHKGNVYLKTALVEAAARAKGTYLRDKFYRFKARPGYKRAAVAIAHKILVSIYHMFCQQVAYHDLGDFYLDNLNKHLLTRTLVRRLERLGYTVTLALQETVA